VRQNLPTFAEDFFKFFPDHKGGDTFTGQAVLFSREYCLYDFKYINRASHQIIFLHWSSWTTQKRRIFAPHRSPKGASGGR